MQTSYLRLSQNNSVDDGHLAKSRSSFDSYDFVEYANQFKSADFDIQSLMTVGAYDMLTPTYVSTMSSMEFADQMQNFIPPTKTDKTE